MSNSPEPGWKPFSVSVTRPTYPATPEERAAISKLFQELHGVTVPEDQPFTVFLNQLEDKDPPYTFVSIEILKPAPVVLSENDPLNYIRLRLRSRERFYTEQEGVRRILEAAAVGRKQVPASMEFNLVTTKGYMSIVQF